ncbi:single-stranded DNA-binding protein [Corynebacterium lactis]|uniref:Single-stranded DNA-binding protein n=1 Tax=Corynebacterium lactis RW2-5 TaxID=1408189 RepID=A0A0K2GYS3_9CORY|nr:single-stranded DNA-binding protein [Corynebacterium lactis]ALA66934.1 single-stranded DNA-binding protein [Corynebacterium lactis RW2-5]
MSEALITVVGNVARQVENRNTNSGAKVCRFVLASSRSWKGESGWEQSETSYFDVECWGKLAENVNNSLWKGQAVIVHGHIRTDSWTADDGGTRYRQKIIAKAVGPNLKRHVATVKTYTEKPHEQPVGQETFGGASATQQVGDYAGEATVNPAEADNQGHGDNEERREPALVGAGVSAGAGAGESAADSADTPF